MINTAIKSALPDVQVTNRRKLVIGLAIAGGVLLLFAGLLAAMINRMNDVPANLDLSASRLSDNGLYRVSYTSSADPLPVNRLHTWTLTVTTTDGRPVENATIIVDGDMPQHGHGMPTRAEVTTNLGDGNYLVEGMKFQMGGWWVIEFDITADGQTDHVAFNLLLQR
jgi:hypothetical protein